MITGFLCHSYSCFYLARNFTPSFELAPPFAPQPKPPSRKGFGCLPSHRVWVWGLGFRSFEFRLGLPGAVANIFATLQLLAADVAAVEVA